MPSTYSPGGTPRKDTQGAHPMTRYRIRAMPPEALRDTPKTTLGVKARITLGGRSTATAFPPGTRHASLAGGTRNRGVGEQGAVKKTSLRERLWHHVNPGSCNPQATDWKGASPLERSRSPGPQSRDPSSPFQVTPASACPSRPSGHTSFPLLMCRT